MLGIFTSTVDKIIYIGYKKDMPITNQLLRYFRLRRGETQAQFAEAMGVKRAAISFWETGRASPPVEKLEEVVIEVLGMTMAKFYGHERYLR
jgi:transcriptional regulator with XRE-family HTH domain